MHKRYKPLLLSTLLLAPASYSASPELSLSAFAGIDTNPYRLSELFIIDEAAFFKYKLKVKIPLTKGLSIKAKGMLQDYNDDSAEWGDNHNFDLRLDYRSGKAADRWGMHLTYREVDKTYVSRIKAVTRTSYGFPLDDRNDYKQTNFNAYKNFKINKYFKNRIETNYRLRDYSDFDHPKITDYDYHAIIIADTLTYKFNRKHKHAVRLSYEGRYFLDRMQKDNTGDNIENSELAYEYLEAGYQYKYKQNKNLSYKIFAEAISRTDNGSGYYDTFTSEIGLGSEYKWQKKSTFSLGYSYRDFAYLREPESIVGLSLEEDYTSERKHILKLANVTHLPKWVNDKTYFEMEYKYANADSNKEEYQYDRHIFQTGIRMDF
ncbi:MAG: hypothetical protein JKY50_06600 [Oleispira sp.]|nr:hypothetical protein [Oleispira sp.]